MVYDCLLDHNLRRHGPPVIASVPSPSVLADFVTTPWLAPNVEHNIQGLCRTSRGALTLVGAAANGSRHYIIRTKRSLRAMALAWRLLAAAPALDLRHCFGVDDQILRSSVCRVTTLTGLDLLLSNRMTVSGFACLRRLTALTELSLNGCEDVVTIDCLQHVATLPSLRQLTITGMTHINTDVAMAQLQMMTTLTSLQLIGNVRLTDAACASIATMRSPVTSLTVQSCEISDVGVGHLSRMAQLVQLDISFHPKITDASLAHVAKLSSLRSLACVECAEITDAGLAHLQTTPARLTTLNFGSCEKITDAGLEHLRTVTGLVNLKLSNCSLITDRGVSQLAASLSALEHISLTNCDNLTDASLAALVPLRYLTDLHVIGCAKMTEAGRNLLLHRAPADEPDVGGDAWGIMTPAAQPGVCITHKMSQTSFQTQGYSI